jgi:hypothetical protein
VNLSSGLKPFRETHVFVFFVFGFGPKPIRFLAQNRFEIAAVIVRLFALRAGVPATGPRMPVPWEGVGSGETSP